ncbi:MAG TPA: helix-turn-helix domain-containing protein [Ilumatobacter sp.]|nr:helix-turn-helix domain-containing protein [Ilumatobacter sp.]
MSPIEHRILDAADACCARFGFSKVTIDDIVAESGVSRATIYRLFPGGRDVLFEAFRVRELEAFFDRLRAGIHDVDGGAETLEDVVVQAVVGATRELRDDAHLAAMMASEPGEALGQLTVAGLPRIVRMATLTLTPFVTPFVSVAVGRRLIDVLSRLTISYFLAPSDEVDLGNADHARAFLRPMIAVLAGPVPAASPTTAPNPVPALELS